jgi:hypothetical protein
VLYFYRRIVEDRTSIQWREATPDVSPSDLAVVEKG